VAEFVCTVTVDSHGFIRQQCDDAFCDNIDSNHNVVELMFANKLKRVHHMLS